MTTICNLVQQSIQQNDDMYAKLFKKQYECLAKSGSTGNIKPTYLPGNTSLLLQEPSNPISYWLYQKQPRCNP